MFGRSLGGAVAVDLATRSDNKDKFKNEMDEVTAMGLMQAEKVSVTKLSAMDYANRRKQCDAIVWQ